MQYRQLPRRTHNHYAQTLLAAVLLALPHSARAADRYWVGSNGTWDDGFHWSFFPGGPGGAGMPQFADIIHLVQSDSLTRWVIYQNGDPLASRLSPFYMDSTGAGTMNFLQFQDTLNPTWEYVGQVGTATFTLSGGTNQIDSALTLGNNPTGNGTYNLKNTGFLKAVYEYIGYQGAGTFNQSGGTNSVGDLFIAKQPGSSGTYNLSGGILNKTLTGYIANSGTFHQSGGTLNASGLYNDIHGSFIFDGGIFNGYLVNWGAATFNADFTAADGVSNFTPLNIPAGRSFTVNGAGLEHNSTLQLAGNLTAASEVVASGGNASVTQSAGTHAVQGDLKMGGVTYNFVLGTSWHTGTYLLSDGRLSVSGDEQIGVDYKGIFIQNGGNHTVAKTLYLAHVGTGLMVAGPGDGVYALNAGSLSVANESIGFTGPGRFTQKGGSHHVAGNLVIADQSTSVSDAGTGAYTLNAGALSVSGNETIGYAGIGTFTHTAGTHAVTGSLILADKRVFTIGGGLLGGDPVTITRIGSGSYTLGPAATLTVAHDEIVGNAGAASFSQTGGDHRIDGSLFLGFAAGAQGAFTLTTPTRIAEGQLIVGGNETVGNAGAGIFTHTGGTNKVAYSLIVGNAAGSNGTYNLSNTANLVVDGTIYVGNYPGSTGAFNLSGGTVSAGYEQVGVYGNASFIQTGGKNTIANFLMIANHGGSTGRYELRGESTLSAASMTNNGTFAQSGGIATFGRVDGYGALAVTGTGLFIADYIRQSSLNLAGSARLRPDNPVSIITAMGLTGSFDLNNNDLILHSGDLSQLTDHLRSKRLFSSAATDFTTLALTPNDRGNGSPIASQWSDIPLIPSDILIKYTWNGDANLDGIVNADDYFLVDSGFITQKGGWYNGDFNYDGTVNADDYFLIDSAFIGQTAILSSRLAAVPEPAALFAAVGAALFLRRRIRS